MSEHHLQPSVAGGVLLPVEEFTLSSLKTSSGNPVRVRCERVDTLEVLRILKCLPGGFESLEPGRFGIEEIAQKFRPFGSLLIERGTVIVREDGSLQRGAFSYERELPDTIPVRLLDSVDFLKLAMCHLKLCGYLGGAADEASFLSGEPGGEGGGAGTVEVLQGARDLAAGGAA